ncbi:MAG: putative GNAT family N-acyltransferase [bacterium]|jgi:predicted GNAT family N-acyltransferase
MIHPEHHKNEYGKKLLEFGIKQIEYLFPSYSIELDTPQYSFPFFEKLEFETKRITQHAYKPGLHKYDMVRKPKLV